MGTINTKKYTPKRPPKDSLTAAMVEGKRTVLTVEWAGEVERQDNTSFVVLEFKEFPDHQYKCNKTQAGALMALVNAGILPDSWDQWKGKRIPFHKQENQNPESGEEVTKLYADEPGEYRKSLAEFEKAKAASVKKTAKSTKK